MGIYREFNAFSIEEVEKFFEGTFAGFLRPLKIGLEFGF